MARRGAAASRSGSGPCESALVMTQIDEFTEILRRVAAGEQPVDAVEAWFATREHQLKSDSELPLKEAVQEALARTWTWRSPHATDAELRASFAAMVARLTGA
jgi:hypothetical protein